MSPTSILDIPNPKPATDFLSHEVSHLRIPSSVPEPPKGRDKTISCSSCRKRKLKCDRVKPKCGTCVRLRHECEYPERRRNPGFRRRNYKDLERRLGDLEIRLVKERKTNTANSESPTTRPGENWNMGINVNVETGNEAILGSFESIQPGMDFSPLTEPATSIDNLYNGQLLSLGLQEPLPPQNMMDDLYEIYFTRFHPTMPIIHRTRFYLSLDLAPNARPPICLSYAMWTLAASLSPKYSEYEDIFYERTRRYLESSEMKGHGESFLTLNHAQTWGLVCNYEARKMYFSRSWMSTGRMVRLVQMLGLWRLDHDESDAKDSLRSPQDWIELEERRRTFWAAFYSDRFASSGSGWPMIIQEHEIFTNLPASEEAFESGVAETTTSLAQALTPEGAPRLSNYGGVLITAAFFGHFFQHVRASGSSNHPEDFQNGEFWKRHRKMEHVLNYTFIYLPESLRLPGGCRDMNVIFIHMNIQASMIGLHRTALTTAGRYRLDPIFIRQCRARTFIAAEEIVNILHLTRKEDAHAMVPWVGFCLYVAAGIFLEDIKGDSPHPHSLTYLDQILNAMRAIARHHSITKGFLTQCELDIESFTKNRFGRELEEESGILAESQGIPITIADMQALLLQPTEKVTKSPSPGKDFSPRAVKASTPSLSPAKFTHIPESNLSNSGNPLDAEGTEFSSWDSRVEATTVRYEDNVSYPSKYSSTASTVVEKPNFVGYNHATPSTNSNCDSQTTPSHEFAYSQESPLGYVKPSICLPMSDSIMADEYNDVSNDWVVPDTFAALNQESYVAPISTDWNQTKFPIPGLRRGGEAG